MPTVTSRAQLRANQIETIKDVARQLIAEKGVAGLSLREVARQMGQVSSALYRYFANRDELLTALILDAYNDLGASVERADARHSNESSRSRWHAAARATRSWATRHPHQYGLIFGTPVPNYEAPELTIAAATRATVVFCRIMNDDRRRRGLSGAGQSARHLSGFLEVANLRAVLPDLSPDDYVRALMAWTELFGFMSFELFGHYVGSVRNAKVTFEHVVDELADVLGFAP